MTNFGGVSGEKLRQLVARIEKLEEEKKEVAECIKEAYGEAKGFGYDVKVLRQLIKIRKQDRSELEEQEAILDVYMHAMGMVPGSLDDAEESTTDNQASSEEGSNSSEEGSEEDSKEQAA